MSSSEAPAPSGDGGRDAIERAFQEVFALCRGKRWTMHIPLEETDSDRVIVEGLKAGESAVLCYDAARAELDALKEAAVAVEVRDGSAFLNLQAMEFGRFYTYELQGARYFAVKRWGDSVDVYGVTEIRDAEPQP